MATDPLVQEFFRLQQRDWSIRISHAYKEGNRWVDWNANRGLDIDIGIQYLSQPLGLLSLLQQDEAGYLYLVYAGCKSLGPGFNQKIKRNKK